MFSKFKVLTIVLGFISIAGYAQVRKDIIPNKYIAYKTPEAIKIDGLDDDASWSKAKWSQRFIDIEGVKIPKYGTQIKMLWDENYFYILAKIEEPHVWADIKERDVVIFHNNDFEVFVDPDGDTHNYFELEINALNTVWDLFLTKPYRERGMALLNEWNITGLKSAITIDGTLNDPSDIDKGWILEIAIPWTAYKTAYNQRIVPVNKFWRVNFSRVNWDHDLNNDVYSRKKNTRGKYLPEYNWVWSPQGKINMHMPEKWGYVYFSSEEVGNKITFNVPSDEKIKWELYKLYNDKKRLNSANKLQIVVEGEILMPMIEKHSFGSIISVRSPFSGKTLIIKEDGRFLKKY